MRIFTWPDQLPTELHDVYTNLASAMADALLIPISNPGALAAARGETLEADCLLIAPEAAVLSGECSTAEAFEILTSLTGSLDQINLVVVVGDGYLGTDLSDLTGPALGGAALAVVRSIAVTRGSTNRANLICVPAGLIGQAGSQRGPLPGGVDTSDLVNAASFLLDRSNAYLNGQVLFVNGGRQLFSSLTS